MACHVVLSTAGASIHRGPSRPAGEQIKWTGYRLDVSKLGTMPDIWLAPLEYIEDDNGAAILYTRYPLSIVRNDQTGEFTWSLNGDAQEVVQERQTQAPADTDALRAQADQLHVGMFEEDSIDVKVQEALDKFKAKADAGSDK